MKLGTKTYYMMHEPEIIGVCHSCKETVDKWNRLSKVKLLTWENHGQRTWMRVNKEVMICNNKCQKEWQNWMDIDKIPSTK